MDLFSRKYVHPIHKWLNKNKIVIVYGPRQVGKSSILQLFQEQFGNIAILQCENPVVRDILTSKNLDRVQLLFGKNKIIALDEAQSIPEVGQILKYIYDSHQFTAQLIVTGSSSFDLGNKTAEALTGRNMTIRVLPLSIEELIENKGFEWLYSQLENILVYGQYPEIIKADISDKTLLLNQLSSDYLFRDVLAIDQVKNSEILRRLLKLLAYQLGQEVKYQELASELGVATQTIRKYLDILEKCYVIIQISSFSRNLRNEIKKTKKIYFYDNGIRNSLIQNFQDISLRTDKGALWENFCVVERIKRNLIHERPVNYYFWRTYDQAEIDLIEESQGQLDLFEFKYQHKNKNIRWPESFLFNYPVRNKNCISKSNFELLASL